MNELWLDPKHKHRPIAEIADDMQSNERCACCGLSIYFSEWDDDWDLEEAYGGWYCPHCIDEFKERPKIEVQLATRWFDEGQGEEWYDWRTFEDADSLWKALQKVLSEEGGERTCQLKVRHWTEKEILVGLPQQMLSFHKCRTCGKVNTTPRCPYEDKVDHVKTTRF